MHESDDIDIDIAAEADYQLALAKMEEKKWREALGIFERLGNYKDSADLTKKCKEEILRPPKSLKKWFLAGMTAIVVIGIVIRLIWLPVPPPKPTPTSAPASTAPTLSDLEAMVASGTVKTQSNKGSTLVLPKESQMLSEPLRMCVDNGQSKGSIYIMPRYQSGHGNLGTVVIGTEVWIVAETNDFYFFVTDNGQMGWNRKVYFN